MIIEIDDTKTIEAVCTEFYALYPFLKMEFYSLPHEWQSLTPHKYLLPHDIAIGEIRTRHNAGKLEIHGWQKTGVVEQAFDHLFGLQVQIFRHHGDQWVQTAGTDELTLHEQNEIGRLTTVEYLHLAGMEEEKGKVF